MALIPALIGETLKEMLEKIDNKPEDRSVYVNEYTKKITGLLNEKVRYARSNGLITIFQNLYQLDYERLKLDVIKIALADGSKDASEDERFELLRCLMGTAELFFNGDYSLLINFCSGVIQENNAMEGVLDLPFY